MAFDLGPWLQALQQNKGNPWGAVGQFMQQRKQGGDWNIQAPVDTSAFGTGSPVGGWLQALMQNKGNPWGAVGQFMQNRSQPAAPAPAPTPTLSGSSASAAALSPLMSMLAGSQKVPGGSGGETYESIKAKYGPAAAKAWEKGQFSV